MFCKSSVCSGRNTSAERSFVSRTAAAVGLRFSMILLALGGFSHADPVPSVTSSPFGNLPDGSAVTLFSLMNAEGMRVDIANYGGIIVRLYAPDRDGRLDDIVLGYDTLDAYLRTSPYFGAVVGRYANRIADGRFELDGRTYRLATNNAPGGIPCHLHGGKVGFDKVLWQADARMEGATPVLRLRHFSKDGEEGYPGNVEVTVTYALAPDNTLKIEYEATTDQATPINLTQHSYFNLKGEGRGDILDHFVTINGRHVTPVDAGLIPTGEIAAVAGTPFDFTTPHRIGERIDDANEQLVLGKGYDHNWVLDHADGRLVHAATVYEPESGRELKVWTTEPGLQFYTGNFLNGTHVGKRGQAYARRSGFCLETQHFPDSPNQPSFPDTILRPGERYHSITHFVFTAK